MLSEKEVKFMENKEVQLIEKEKNYYLTFKFDEEVLEISLTEDKPNDIKLVFNKLIEELKKEKFNLIFTKKDETLYSLISEEYISQLNTELDIIYNELNDYGMTSTSEGDK